MAQKIPFQNFGVADGLMDQNCFDVIQDSAGFIWIGTNTGVVRFDGVEFKTYGPKSKTIAVFQLRMQGNRLVLRMSSVGIYVLEGDSMYQPESLRQLHLEMQEKGLNIESMAQDEQGIVWVGCTSKRGGPLHFYSISPDNEVKEVTKLTGPDRNAHAMVFNNGQCVHASFAPLDKLIQITLDTPDGEVRHEFQDRQTDLPVFLLDVVYSSDHTVAIAYRDQVLLSNASGTKRLYRGTMLQRRGLFFENDSVLWVASQNGTTNRICFDPESFDIKEDIEYTALHETSSMYRGANEGLWLTSLTQGLYHAPILHMCQHTDQKDITALCHCAGAIYASTRDGHILTYSSNGSLDTVHQNRSQILALDCVDSTLVALGYDPEGILETRVGKLRNVRFHGARKVYVFDSAYCLAQKSDVRIYRNDGECVKYKLAEHTFVSWVPVSPDHYFARYRGKLHHIRLTAQGAEIDPVSLASPVMCMLGGKGNVAMYSDYAGCLWSIDSSAVPQKVSNELPFLKEPAQYAFTENGRLVFYSGSGIMSIDPQDMDGTNATYLARLPGIFPGEIKDLSKTGDRYFWLSNGCLFSSSKSFDQGPSRLPSVKLQLEGSDMAYASRLVLDYMNNSVSLVYSGFNFSKNPHIRYVLSSTSNGPTNTFELESNKVFLPDLSTGHHELSVHSYHYLTGRKSTPVSVFVEVDGPLWLEWWFILAATLAVAIPLLYLGYLRSKARIENERLDMRIASLRSKAVETQLSPHFVFNALGSIQYLIATNKNEEANDYLVQFARLLSSVVENSSKHWYSFANEWELLTSYLSLENLRFKKETTLRYVNQTSHSIEQLLIPPLMLQVLVENSLQHGLRRVDYAGCIELVIAQPSEDILEVCVWDNGVGFSPERMPKKQRTSKGLLLIQQRLEAITKSHELPSTLDYGNEDRDGFHAFACIRLPLQIQERHA